MVAGVTPSAMNILPSSLINSAYATNEDVDVLTELMRTNQFGENIKYFDLFERIIKTNRCFWQTSYSLDNAITLGEPLEAQWQWLALGNNLHTLQLRVHAAINKYSHY